MVSVVMTVFSQSPYLEEAVRSILSQTYNNLEFLVVLEHGTDAETAVVLRSLADEDCRIRLIYNESRLGLAESLNAGIRAAKGKYIARMDDDDVSLPQRLERQVKFMDGNPEIGLCGTLQIAVTPEKVDITSAPVDVESLKAEMLFGCQISHTSVMFRRDVFLQNGWLYDGTKIAEDYDLWMRILDKTKMANLAEPLVKHRFGFGNRSLDKGEALAEEFNQTIRRNLQRFLGIDCSSYPPEIFCSWRRFPEQRTEGVMAKLLVCHLDLLREMEAGNRVRDFAEPSAFTGMLMHRFRWFYKEIVRRSGKSEFFFRWVETYKLDSGRTFKENLLAMAGAIESKSNILSELDKSFLAWCQNEAGFGEKGE